MTRLTNRLAEKLLAAKTGAIVGVLTAAAVVVREIRKRRKLN